MNAATTAGHINYFASTIAITNLQDAGIFFYEEAYKRLQNRCQLRFRVMARETAFPDLPFLVARFYNLPLYPPSS